MPNIYGQLLNAQLENSAGTPASGGTPTGRIYIDTTNASNGVPKYYNGTTWLPLLAQAPLISQTATLPTTTVNWANGLYQQVVLGAHTVISFTNPVAGQTHVLVVSQKATEIASTTPWMYQFNLPDQDSRRLPYLVGNAAHSSENQVWAWYYQSTIRASYATIPASAANPGALPSTLITGIDVHPTKNVISGGRTGSPFGQSLLFYDGGSKFTYGVLNQSTFTTLAAQAVGVSYSPDGQLLCAVSGTTAFLQAVPCDIYGIPSGTVINPTALAGAGQCVSVHPSGSHVIAGHTTTPFMSCLPINSGALGAKITNPVTLPAAQVNGVAWSPVGDFVAGAGQTTPFLQVWPFDPFTGFGAIVTAPVSLPAGGPPGALGRGVAWHPSGAYIALAMNSSPFVTVYPFNRSAGGAFGTPISPAGGNIPAATINCVAWSPCGNYLFAGCSASTFLYVYDFSAQTMNTLVTYDGSNPGQVVNDIVFTKSGDFVILALNASPFIMTYPVPRKAKNYLKLTW